MVSLEAYCPKVDHLENGLSEARIIWINPTDYASAFLIALPIEKAQS
jgi:hypothetical protein